MCPPPELMKISFGASLLQMIVFMEKIIVRHPHVPRPHEKTHPLPKFPGFLREHFPPPKSRLAAAVFPVPSLPSGCASLGSDNFPLSMLRTGGTQKSGLDRGGLLMEGRTALSSRVRQRQRRFMSECQRYGLRVPEKPLARNAARHHFFGARVTR